MQTIDLKSEALPLPQNYEDEVSILNLLIVFLRRKWFILGSTLLVAIITAIYSMIVPFGYTATTVILPPQTSSSGSALLSQLGPTASLLSGSFGLKSPNDMSLAIMKSRTVEDAMVQRFGLKAKYHVTRQSDARALFRGQYEIESGKDGLIHISVSDGDANRAAEIANAYVEEFRRFSGTLAITEAAQRRLFFEQQLSQAKDNLANSEEALKRTQQTTGLIQPDSQAQALISAAGSLRGEIAAKEVEIRAMRSFSAEGNPDLQLAEQQLAGWRAQLSRLAGDQHGSGNDMMISKGQVSEAGLEYLRKLRDVKYYSTIFELLAKQFESAKLDEARQGSLIQVIDPAVPPDRRASPKRAIMVLKATAITFFLSILWVLVTAALASARKDPDSRERLKELKQALLSKPLAS